MNAIPTYNKIIVKPEADEEVSRGGIFLPVTVERQQTKVGVVVAVGPGRITENGTLVPCCVKVGDRILYSRHVGFPIEIDGEKFTATSDVEAMIIFPEASTKAE